MERGALIPLDYEPEPWDDELDQTATSQPSPSPAPEAPPIQKEAEPARLEPVKPEPVKLERVVVPPAPELPEVIDETRPQKAAPKLTVLDYEPAPFEEAKTAEAKPFGATSPWVRGAVTGTVGGVEDAGAAAQVFKRITGGKDDSILGKIGRALDTEGGPTGYEREVPTIADIGDKEGIVSDTYTYLAETLASGLASTFPSLAGGAAGAAVGTAIAPGPGTGVGAFAGAAIPSFISGVGGASGDLRNDPEIAEALRTGKITDAQLDNYAVGAGALIGAFDAIGAGKLVKLTGLGKEAVDQGFKTALLTAVKKGLKEGVLAEGITEAAQQMVSEGAQLFAGGDTNASQMVLNVVESFIGGALVGGTVGGAGAAVENTKKPLPPKVDDVPDKAAPTQPEGTPAAPAPAAGQPTPGGTGVVAPPPAGVEKQPTSPGPAVAVPGTDPRTDAKPPQPQPPVQPGVTVVKPGTVAPDVGVVLGGEPAAGAGPANLPGVQPPVAETVEPEEEEEIYDIGAEIAEDDPDRARRLTEEAELIRDMYREERAEAERQKSAEIPTVQKSGVDEAAALAASAPKAAAPAPTIPPPPAVPAQRETLGTGRALQEPAPAAPGITPVPPSGPVAAAAPAPAPPAPIEQQAPAELPVPPAVGVAPEPTSQAAPELLPEAPAAAEVTPVSTAAAAEPAPAPEHPARARVEAAERAPVAEPLPAPPAPTEPVVAPKGTALKQKAKKAKIKPAERAPVAEAPTPQPTPPSQPAAAPAPARPVQTRISRDTAAYIRDEYEPARQSTATELPGYRDTVEDVTARYTAQHPRRADQSPREYMREHAPAITAAIEAQVAKDKEAHDIKSIRTEEAVTVAGRKKQAKEAKREAQAAAETGQKKERTGKKKGKSAVGIESEKERTISRAVKKTKALPEEKQDKLLLAWDALRQKRRGTEGEVRAEIDRQMEEVQQLRAERAAREEEEGKLRERAEKLEESVKKVAPPLPPSKSLPRGETAQANAMQAHLDAFWNAVKDLPLAGKPSRQFNSLMENLAIYARKLSGKKSKLNGNYFYMAHSFAEAGALDEFYALTTTESLKGTGGKEVGKEEAAGLKRKVGAAYTESEELSHLREGAFTPGGAVGATPEEILIARQERIQGLRRGRIQTLLKDRAQRQREGRRYKDFQPQTITRPDGSTVEVLAETRAGSEVLREASQTQEDTAPFITMLRSMLTKHLTQLVGDVDVLFVSRETMGDLGKSEAAGIYYNYSDEMRAAGHKPKVFIATDIQGDPVAYSHTVFHEMTHAATSQALRDGVRGTDRIVAAMMRSLRPQLQGFDYAFKNPSEFIAEAFSNQAFQQALASTVVPPSVQARVAAIARGRTATFWDTFVAAVSNAIGVIRGSRGQTYMEQVIKVLPTVSRSSFGQQREAVENLKREAALKAAIPRWDDTQALQREIEQVGRAVKAQADTSWKLGARKLRFKLAPTDELIRISRDVFGGVNNAFERLALAAQEFENRYRRVRKDEVGYDVELAQQELEKNDPVAWKAAQEFMLHSNRFALDGRYGLHHPRNKTVSKTGHRSAQRREELQNANAAWAKLPQHAKDVVNKIADHFEAMHELDTKEMIEERLRAAQRQHGATLPPGKTLEDAINWLRSPAALRKVDERDQTDKDFHQHLGKTATTLANVQLFRKLPGIYVPQMRRGKYFVAAKRRGFQKTDTLPKGATYGGENRLLFKNQKDAEDFAKSADWPVNVGSRHVDINTGKQVNPNEIGAVRQWVATVQLNEVHQSDSIAELEEIAASLKAEGASVDQIANTKENLHRLAADIAPAQIRSLLKHIDGTEVGKTTIGQEGVKNAVLEAWVRQMSTPGRLSRHLKRRNVRGASDDIGLALIDYNDQLAGGIAGRRSADSLARAEADLDAEIRTGKKGNYAADNRATLTREAMANELKGRISAVQEGMGRTSGLERVSRAVKNVTFLKHLASIHFSVMNQLQTLTTTMPMLGARYGDIKTAKVWKETMEIGGGVRGTWWRGIKETGRALTNLNPKRAARQPTDAMDAWIAGLRGELDGHHLLDVLEDLDRYGYGSTGATEVGRAAEAEMNIVEKGIQRGVNVARALPESLEAFNRSVTAITTYRLEIERLVGDGPVTPEAHEAAKREAVLMTAQTQGGYGAMNNPAFFSDPKFSWATTFKKYGLFYGNMWWGAAGRTVFGKDKATRREAARQLTRLSATTAVFAGVFGLPFIEVLRTFVNMAVAAGADIDDWDEQEVKLQEWLNSMLGWATGNEDLGDRLSEASLKGLTRLINLDTSSSLGADSLITFNQPQTMDEKGTALWMLKMIIGAPGGMMWDTIKGINKAEDPLDYLAAMPWPKFMKSAVDAYDQMTNGTYNKETGEQYTDPAGAMETLYKLIGFRGATESREWEAGGGGTAAKQEKSESRARSVLMGRWSNADPGEQQRIFNEEVREWNATHQGRDRIEYRDLLHSKRKRAEQKKERELERSLQ